CCLINQLTSTFILLPSKWYHFSQFFFHKKTDLTVCSLKSNCYLILLLPSSIKFLLTSINLAVSILTLLGCSKDILQNAVQLVVCSISILSNRNTVQVLHSIFKFRSELYALVILVFTRFDCTSVYRNVTSSISPLNLA